MHHILCLIVLLLPCTAIAQPQQDIRLSPPDPLVDTLPQQYRIQSAHSIGPRTLVVWGTSRNISDKQIAGQLRFQLLKDGTPFGPQRVLTSDNADPQTFVRVVPLASQFLVIWLDRRPDSAGLYAMLVDGNGNKLNAEHRIGPAIESHAVFGTQVWVAGTPENGQLLYWHINNGTRTWTTGLRIDRNGLVVESLREIGHIVQDILRFETFPGMAILRFDDKTILVDEAGRIDKRAVQEDLFESPYHLDTDTSLIRLKEKKIEKYASLFTEQPMWSYPVPQLDSAFPGSTAVGRDSVGTPFIVFATTLSTGTEASSGWFSIALWRIELDVTDKLIMDSLQRIYVFREPNGAYDHPSGELKALKEARVDKGCDNSILITLEIQMAWIYHTEILYPLRFSTLTLFINKNKVLKTNSSGYQPSCAGSSIAISRDPVGSELFIYDSLQQHDVRLKTPLALYRIEVSQQRPHLIRDSTDIYLTWSNNRDGEILAKLSGTFDSVAKPIDTLVIPPPEIKTEYYLVHSGFGPSHISSISSGTHMALLSNQEFHGDIRLHNPNATPERHFFNAIRLYQPADTEWVTLYENVPELSFSYRATIGGILGHNKAGDFVIGMFQYNATGSWPIELPQQASPQELLHYSSNGQLLYSGNNTSVTGPGFWMPMDSAHYLVIQQDQAIQLHNGSLVNTFPLSPAGNNVRVVPLNATSFLRVWNIDTTTVALDIYTIQGIQLTSNTLYNMPIDVLAENVPIVQRTSDSALLLMWGTQNGGIHAMLLNSHLRIAVADTVISHYRGKALNPSGLFTGDTLFVVWEDYRNGKPDIYGNSLVLPPAHTLTTRAHEEERRTQKLNATIQPNPTQNALHIHFSSRLESDATIQIFDIMGKLIWSGNMQKGSSARTIDRDGLHNGIHYLRWKNRTQSGIHQVVVLR